MLRRKKRITTSLTPLEALARVTGPDGTVFANPDFLKQNLLTASDSLIVAYSILNTNPGIAYSIITTLASLQGKRVLEETGEQPGKICQWAVRKGAKLELDYHGIIETAAYIKLVADYINLKGNGLLTAYVLDKEGKYLTIYESLVAAVEWLDAQLATSKSHLLQSYQPKSSNLKHSDGSPLNTDLPVALTAHQGLTYDALLAAAKLLPSMRAQLESRASKLARQVLHSLWLPAENYFAHGLDYAGNGRLRRIEVISAAAGQLLNSSLLESVPLKFRQAYLRGIVEKLFSIEFLSDGGLRDRSLRHQFMFNYWDAGGSFTITPARTSEIAKGLRKQGLPRLAEELENRLQNVVSALKNYPDVIFVDSECRILNAELTTPSHLARAIRTSIVPQVLSANTASTCIGLGDTRSHRLTASGPVWLINLEEGVLARIKHMPRLTNADSLKRQYSFLPFSLTMVRT